MKNEHRNEAYQKVRRVRKRSFEREVRILQRHLLHSRSGTLGIRGLLYDLPYRIHELLERVAHLDIVLEDEHEQNMCTIRALELGIRDKRLRVYLTNMRDLVRHRTTLFLDIGSSLLGRPEQRES